ncbi:hypothetical protein H2248_007756 [Termitomyces sp. 'cryptogamus']|nr:hypothetical protein H2248_007756 [Termitomyces sp. 'cryptogamus']
MKKPRNKTSTPHNLLAKISLLLPGSPTFQPEIKDIQFNCRPSLQSVESRKNLVKRWMGYVGIVLTYMQIVIRPREIYLQMNYLAVQCCECDITSAKRLKKDMKNERAYGSVISYGKCLDI